MRDIEGGIVLLALGVIASALLSISAHLRTIIALLEGALQ